MTSVDSAHSAPSDFDGWWNVQGEWVEPPNYRRNGWSGMMRFHADGQCFYVKRQCNHLYRSLRHPFGYPTATREFANILILQVLGIRVPEPVFHGTRKTSEGFEAVLVTRELTGFVSLSEQRDLTTAQRTRLAGETGRVLGIMHRGHFQHSCLYDKHIMVRWQEEGPEVALIDLEKLRRPLVLWHAAAHDLDQLRRHQAIWAADEWQLLLRAHRRSMTGRTSS